RQALGQGGTLEGAIIACQLRLLARHLDSLIARKLGPEEAAEVSRRARGVLESGWGAGQGDWQVLDELDGWLREAGHRRNPGTTADLVAASLFAALQTGLISPAQPF